MKKGEISAILREVSFQSDQMQVLSLRPRGTEIDFPLTKAPINFSVLSDRGLSVRWGVKVERNGDAYIYNRDIKNAEKVSLHASGNQHIAMTDETAIRVGAGNRFGPRWTEPTIDQTAVPTFSIAFPPWGNNGRRPENLATKKGELLIIGHVTKVVLVGFFIIGSGTKLQVHTPHFVLGTLALRPGKILHVVAWKEPENNLRNLLRASYKQISTPLPVAEDLVLNFQGFREHNSAYMVAVPPAALG